jgi:microtubule-associated protein 1
MKKALLIAVLVVVSVALVSTVFAAEAKAPKAMTFKGTVTGMDAAKNMLTVKGEKKDMSFNVAGAKWADYKAMDEVKAGDKVVVKYVEKEGKMMATTVGKAPVKAAKAPAKTTK